MGGLRSKGARYVTNLNLQIEPRVDSLLADRAAGAGLVKSAYARSLLDFGLDYHRIKTFPVFAQLEFAARSLGRDRVEFLAEVLEAGLTAKGALACLGVVAGPHAESAEARTALVPPPGLKAAGKRGA